MQNFERHLFYNRYPKRGNYVDVFVMLETYLMKNRLSQWLKVVAISGVFVLHATLKNTNWPYVPLELDYVFLLLIYMGISRNFLAGIFIPMITIKFNPRKNFRKSETYIWENDNYIYTVNMEADTMWTPKDCMPVEIEDSMNGITRKMIQESEFYIAEQKKIKRYNSVWQGNVKAASIHRLAVREIILNECMIGNKSFFE